MSKWFLEIVQDFNGKYYANLAIDGKRVEGLPEYVDYNTLKNAIRQQTGIEILKRNELIFQGRGKKKFAYIDATQPGPRGGDCRVTLADIDAGWKPAFDTENTKQPAEENISVEIDGKQERFAHIPLIHKGVVFSDPWYDENVWCQYRKEFHADNWVMKMGTKANEEFPEIIEFELYLGRPTMVDTTKTKEDDEGNISVSHFGHYDTKEVQIAMDTACIFCGNLKNWEQYGESAAMKTGTDGFFGDLVVFNCKGNDTPVGFLLSGSIEDLFVSEKELFDHFVSSFDAKEINREEFKRLCDPTRLQNKLLLSGEIRTAMAAEKDKPKNQINRTEMHR